MSRGLPGTSGAAAPGGAAVPGGATPALPDLATIRRWTRDAQRRRRRLTRTLGQDLSDVYTALLTVVVLGAMTLQALSAARPDAAHPRSLPGISHRLTGLSPTWLEVSAVLALCAAAVGALRRLGPVFVRPEQAVWWLPLPGPRRRLLAGSLLRVLEVGAVVGIVVGTLLAVSGGAGLPSVPAWALTCVGAGFLALTGAVSAQVGARGLHLVRTVLLALATMAAALSAVPPRSVPSLSLPLLGALLAGGSALWLGLGVRPRLENLEDRELLETGHRVFGVGVAGLSLDTRALGRLLAPPLRRPRRLSTLRVARAAAGRASSTRAVLGVAQADLLLIRRQPWRFLQLLASVLIACLLLVPGLPWVTAAAIILVSAWVAVLGAAAPARQVAFDGGPDATWPVSPAWVRLGHLVLPALWMLVWTLATGIVCLLAGAHGSAAALLATLLVAAPGWGAVAVRSGLRRTPDWSMLVSTPFGALPAGLFQTLTAGPDAAALVALPMLAAIVGGWTGLSVVGIQAATSLAAVIWALNVGQR